LINSLLIPEEKSYILGQMIFVSPRQQAVVVRFGLDDGGVDWFGVAQSILEKIPGE